MTGEYKSTERIIWENTLGTEPARNFFRKMGYFCEGVYGTVAGLLRLPTSLRKAINKQTAYQLTNASCLPSSLSDADAVMIGHFAGGVFLFLSAINSATSTGFNDDFSRYTGLTALITNAASAAFELGRLNRSKQEFNEAYPKREELEDAVEQE